VTDEIKTSKANGLATWVFGTIFLATNLSIDFVGS